MAESLCVNDWRSVATMQGRLPHASVARPEKFDEMLAIYADF
ncbi:MAG: hypothetical protein ABSG16_01390 [Candidatus Acidiferrum sp.]